MAPHLRPGPSRLASPPPGAHPDSPAAFIFMPANFWSRPRVGRPAGWLFPSEPRPTARARARARNKLVARLPGQPMSARQPDLAAGARPAGPVHLDRALVGLALALPTFLRPCRPRFGSLMITLALALEATSGRRTAARGKEVTARLEVEVGEGQAAGGALAIWLPLWAPPPLAAERKPCAVIKAGSSSSSREQ